MFDKFKPFAAAFLTLFGIEAYSKDNNQKNVLTEDQQKALVETYGFGKEFVEDFNKALANDFKDDAKSKDESKDADAATKAVVTQLTLNLSQAMTDLAAITKEKGDLSQEVSDKQKEITDLTAKVNKLAGLDEEDPGKGAQHGSANKDLKIDLMNEKQLCGYDGARFLLENRPYNVRARAAMLYHQEGMSIPVVEAKSLDYQALKEDLGDFYRTRWQDKIQSLLVVLPSIEKIFPCEYGYQDRATLINVWLGEFSQADNTASDFDNVVKGDYEFEPEELRMFSVMFAHKFKNLKALEQTWIGYLNEEGSQVMKWSFIEFILAKTAEKLHNERELRRINGRRKDPDVDKAGSAMEASDGIYEFIRKKVEGWKKNGVTVYQIKPFRLGSVSQGNIGDVLYRGTGMIPAPVRDSGQLECNIPSHMFAWYMKYQEMTFGTNTDYQGTKACIWEYPNVKINVIPNADNHNRIIWTIKGNLKPFAHVKGEMTDFSIEQQDWTLKVWSNWKESFWARMVGYCYKNKMEMDGSRQMIWCNEYDYSESYFVGVEKDNATPSVLIHTSIVTPANTAVVDITDIKDAELGRKIRIQNGSDVNGVKITKTGKFSLITADWIPGKGEIINLMKRADGKFIELGRETAANAALGFPADETTPSLEGATEFVSGLNTQATEITNFTDAIESELYTIYGNGTANASVIKNAGKFSLTADMTLSEGSFIKLVSDGDTFYEIERS